MNKKVDINTTIRLNVKIAYLMMLKEKLKYVKTMKEVDDIEKLCNKLKKEIIELMKK